MTSRKGNRQCVPFSIKKTGQAKREKDRRRGESDARNAVWRAKTPVSQILWLDDRGMRAIKQRARIMVKLAAKNKKDGTEPNLPSGKIPH